MNNIFLIQVNGKDTKGVTAALADVLSNAIILDINQEIVHKHLSLGILVSLEDLDETAAKLTQKIQALFDPKNLSVSVSALSPDDYEKWAARQGAPRYIITLLAPEIRAQHLAKVAKVIASQGLNINEMNRLSGRISLVKPAIQPRSCIEIELQGTPKDIVLLKKQFLELSDQNGIDLSFQEDNLFRRHRSLIVFDMDSTLIQTEVIDEMARKRGIFDQVSQITAAAMRGELDFRQSLIKRLSLLKGLPTSVLADIAQNLPLTPGAARLITTLKKMGYHTAILSGGFNYFGQYLKQKLGMDEVYANELEIVDNQLTGCVLGDIMDATKKEQTLRGLASARGLSLEQTVAVGDGANDIPMIAAAGLGVAFHAKPKVRASAHHSISNMGLDAILYLMGIRDRDVG